MNKPNKIKEEKNINNVGANASVRSNNTNEYKTRVGANASVCPNPSLFP